MVYSIPMHRAMSQGIRKFLIKGADGTDSVPESFQLFALRDSKLDHTGTTSIRDPKVSHEKLDAALLSFSEDGRMYSEQLAAAANRVQRQDPGLKGTMTQTVEFITLLEVFGGLDDKGKRYLTSNDVSNLWLHGRFSQGWVPRGINEIGTDDILKGVALIAIQRVHASLGLQGKIISHIY